MAEPECSDAQTFRDLDQAFAIHRRIVLPLSTPVLEGYEIAALNRTCASFGGDYSNFFPYPDGRLAIVLADFSSTGLLAAKKVSKLHSNIQALTAKGADPASAVTALNVAILAERERSGDRVAYATLIYGILRPGSGLFRFCNAGHVYPLLIRANRTIEEVLGGGTIIGLLKDCKYTLNDLELEEGDLLAIFTDGVVEHRGSDKKEFGSDRLATFLQAHAMEPCLEILKNVEAAVREWGSSNPFYDDFTLMLIRRTC